jgi:aminopeptidase N
MKPGISKFTLLPLLLLFFPQLHGQDHLHRLHSTDIQHYSFSVNLSDTSDMIYGDAVVTILFKEPVQTLILDLAGKDENGKGMTVLSITEGGKAVNYIHHDDFLTITIDSSYNNTTRSYHINYAGIPSDGLIISKNKFGDRTFFGDNWPDRAHNWIPCIDHPSDKATVEFKVSAPDHYRVIANGRLVEETKLDNHYTFTYWHTDVPLPTKVMVIGVARFAVEDVKNELNIPVSTWVYPQNAGEGFRDYLIAPEPLGYYIQQIGPYPFTKLANVQSTTLYGGMENAGNIFYQERLVTGKQKQEGIIAHEIAHQWFGNSVSEKNWYHIWLSEGFATYLTDLYMENKYGEERFSTRMERERNIVIRYATRTLSPVIDTTITDYRDLLSPNSYQKGAWFLHMLRKELGDELFWKCLQSYYEKYQYSNALTEDLKHIAGSISGKDLDYFFKQWLYQPGHPVLDIHWQQDKSNIEIEIEQTQQGPAFIFPLELELVFRDGSTRTENVNIDQPLEKFTIPANMKIEKIIPDPEVWLLFEIGKLFSETEILQTKRCKIP